MPAAGPMSHFPQSATGLAVGVDAYAPAAHSRARHSEALAFPFGPGGAATMCGSVCGSLHAAFRLSEAGSRRVTCGRAGRAAPARTWTRPQTWDGRGVDSVHWLCSQNLRPTAQSPPTRVDARGVEPRQ